MTKQVQDQNIGPLDRATRIIIGLLMVATRYFFQINNVWGDLLTLFGAIGIWEGMLGYCLGYGLLGWSTRRRRRTNRERLA